LFNCSAANLNAVHLHWLVIKILSFHKEGDQKASEEELFELSVIPRERIHTTYGPSMAGKLWAILEAHVLTKIVFYLACVLGLKARQ
jgi:hypothetical protein